MAKGVVRELANVPFSAEAQTKESLCKEMPEYESSFEYEGVWIGFKNVQIAPNTDLIDFENWTLRIRKTDYPSPRLLLLLHGFTGDENSMWVFARDLPSHYWIIAPRAPHVTEPSGYSWRPLQAGTFGRPSLEQLRPAAEALIGLVDAYQLSAGMDVGVFDVMGFSQGAAMSNVLA